MKCVSRQPISCGFQKHFYQVFPSDSSLVLMSRADEDQGSLWRLLARRFFLYWGLNFVYGQLSQMRSNKDDAISLIPQQLQGSLSRFVGGNSDHLLGAQFLFQFYLSWTVPDLTSPESPFFQPEPPALVLSNKYLIRPQGLALSKTFRSCWGIRFDLDLTVSGNYSLLAL